MEERGATTVGAADLAFITTGTYAEMQSDDNDTNDAEPPPCRPPVPMSSSF